MGFIYLLKEREHIRFNEEIYKIGSTKNPIKIRVKGYPIDSNLIFLRPVINHIEVEQNLLKLFDKQFIQRKNIGREYFEGDIKEMINVINEHINQYIKTTNNINVSLPIKNEKNYIKTKDLFFSVDITYNCNDHMDDLLFIQQDLESTFIYTLCGSYGEKIFFNRSKNAIDTHSVVAARYNLDLNTGTLYGVIRYKYQARNKMTLKKLQNMINSYFYLKKVKCLGCNDNYHYNIKDIDTMLKLTTKGSDINDFYIEDV